MSTRLAPPNLSARATDQKLFRKLDEKRTAEIFRQILLGILGIHLLFSLLITRSGLVGYLRGWKTLLLIFADQPVLVLVPAFALVALHRGLVMYRSPDLGPVVLPGFPPVPDLRFDNRLYVGSGWTRDGKQPGDELGLEDELFDEAECHVILEEAGLFGNVHVKGGIGSGKTSTLIMPVLDQAIAKWPRPPLPSDFPLGADGRYKGAIPADAKKIKLSWKEQLRNWRQRGAEVSAEAGSPAPLLDSWEPYTGMTVQEAEVEYVRLRAQHQEKKWGIFLLDPKGDMTDQVQRLCVMAGREEDFIALRPDGEYTYNPLTVSASPLVQAEMVMDGIEAVSGQAVQQYWRSTMSEWITNALEILRVVEPTRITFKNLLRMARSEPLCQRLVSAAEAVMRSSMEEEERLRRLGQPYHGIRVNPAAIEFFRDWLDEDADPSRKQGVVSGVKSQAKFFVDDKTAPFLCPELPPTFTGFDDMIDQGRVVVLSMPLDEFGPVAKVLGILVLCDAQQAARARINRPEMNQERVVLFAIDEIANYLNPATRDFVSMNRQSRVCVLAAHQSQAQLMKQDRSFENSFNDNFRTKMSYCAPNAISGRSESALFGGRKVYKERISQNTVFNRVEREWGKEAVNPVGGESQSFSVSVDEVDRAWFEPEEFMGLRTGEMVVLPFDGETQLLPRKIRCPAFFRSERARLMKAVDIESQKRPPHPIAYVSSREDDQKYLSAGLQQAGYVIAEPLADAEGDMVGFKFITDVGTLIVELDAFDSAETQSLLEERMTHPQTLILFADFPVCSQFFAGDLGLQMERVAAFSDLYRRAFPNCQGRSLYQILEERTSTPRVYEPLNSWAFHSSFPANRRPLTRDSRAINQIYSEIGKVLATLPDEEMEAMYEQTRERIASILRGEDPDPSPTPEGGPDGAGPLNGPGTSEAESEGEASNVNPEDIAAPFSSESDDPFAGDAYPEEVLSSMQDELESMVPLLNFEEPEVSFDAMEVFGFDEPEEAASVLEEFTGEAEIDDFLADELLSGVEDEAAEPKSEAEATDEAVDEAAAADSLAEIARREINAAIRLMEETDIGPLDHADSIEFLFETTDPTESTAREPDSAAPSSSASSEEPAASSPGTPRRGNARPTRRAPRKPAKGEALDFGFDPPSPPAERDGAGGTGGDDRNSDDGFGAPL